MSLGDLALMGAEGAWKMLFQGHSQLPWKDHGNCKRFLGSRKKQTYEDRQE